MSTPLEDYALIGDTYTAALVSRSGSIDWLCLPRFDSSACFAALLGGPEHGHWTLAPKGDGWTVRRRYLPDSLVLETTYSCPEAEVRVLDCMPVRGDEPDLLRRVEGVRGRVLVRSELMPRFDYGKAMPWLRSEGRRLHAVAGPDHLTLDSDLEHDVSAEDHAEVDFSVGASDAVDFRLSWSLPEEEVTAAFDVGAAIEETAEWWRTWTDCCSYSGEYRDAVVRSLITLKALTYAPTGGMVAAPTTSLPEQLGGVRNWDYRYCWIRDATFTLLALLAAGYDEEAKEWREWLLRAVAGRPEQMQIMYGVDGQRRLPELELGWLPGYEGSRPVRIGNDAAQQYQLDVYGELMDALHQARAHGIPPNPDAWRLQRRLMDFLEGHWQDPDNGIWEVRGPQRHFTHSKIMAWAAADRAVKAVEDFGLDGPAEKWKRLRQEIFDEVCKRGYDPDRNTFTQYYGSQSLDAALLMIPNVGFLPATDDRVRGTVAAVEKELLQDGFVQRYTMTAATQHIDGLPSGEGAFLPCTFWLADNYILQGNVDKGRALFERMLDLRNDVGLLSEEYDPHTGRLVGNFPQALSHIPLIDTAFNLTTRRGPAQRRAETGEQQRRGI
ncbi:Glucoamylase (glucan-1,4-alpha-glucosidase), GH15 family [Amycolatopsis arida]|uniref:Trehalase n=1 Tax=Amycolatopsis arida TaxID=587909 RepID=A0A1I5ZB89_9PSEU|nr:glycoside hydrolase family 15 protein [Amycolatopsis arida]TDX89489.1 GH15 family glucan-1,4-alpha-glucosidase [Amycolatopsis arida]SFQ53786.1 Glucoamylase (glucan-1,4-alpha-glucosidase), GH15 family [Amycolatopsis arida]